MEMNALHIPGTIIIFAGSLQENSLFLKNASVKAARLPSFQ